MLWKTAKFLAVWTCQFWELLFHYQKWHVTFFAVNKGFPTSQTQHFCLQDYASDSLTRRNCQLLIGSNASYPLNGVTYRHLQCNKACYKNTDNEHVRWRGLIASDFECFYYYARISFRSCLPLLLHVHVTTHLNLLQWSLVIICTYQN